jgi:hypothetical protein
MNNISSSRCTNYDNMYSIAPESEILVIVSMCRIGRVNSISINASFPYTNLKGVCPIKLFILVMYAHNNA